MPVPLSPLSVSSPPPQPPQSSPPLPIIRSLTSISTARALLALVDQEEQNLEAELEEALAEGVGVEREVGRLDGVRPPLTTLLTHSSQLSALVSKAATLAERISVQVTRLEGTRERVARAREVVDGVREVESILHTLTSALPRRDLPLATSAAQKFLLLDMASLEPLLEPDSHSDSDPATRTGLTAHPSTSTSTTPPVPVPVPGSLAAMTRSHNPVPLIRAHLARLSDMLSDAFDEAVAGSGAGPRTGPGAHPASAAAAPHADRDRDRGDAAVAVLVMMARAGFGEAGMEKMAAWACGEVARRAGEGMRGWGQVGGPPASALLTSLFEHVADLVDRLQPTVEAHFGRDRTRYLCRRLQRECDVRGGMVVEGFLEAGGVARKCASARNFRPTAQTRTPATSSTTPQSTAGPSDDGMGIDSRELDGLLNEMAMMSQREALYERFLEGRVGDIPAASPSTPAEEDFIRGSKLASRVQELMGDYVQLEELFVRMSIDKALSIDTVDASTNTSSSPDDVFYVLRKSLQRTLSSLSVDSLCAMLNLCGRVLETDYVEALGRRVAGAWTGQDMERARAQFMVAVNDADLVVGYLGKLVGELREEVPRGLGRGVWEKNRDKVLSCLAGLEEYAAGFRQLLKNWIENLFTQTLRPRLRIMLSEVLRDAKYVLTDEEYSDLQDGAFTKRVIGTLTRMMETYENTYTENNYAATMNLVLDYVVREWEKHIMANLRFNQLGAIRFEKDLRSLTSALSAMSTVNVRDKMTRLSQISDLVNLE
ncbi:Golgi transport complex subunit 4 [Gonapodya sp. JEL0774]|nr:Golgi transport complex subunit 4 [Gonapodya sp. JEL0774]